MYFEKSVVAFLALVAGGHAAVGQVEADQAVSAPVTASAPDAEPSSAAAPTPSPSSLTLSLSALGGTLNVDTDVNREVDKTGSFLSGEIMARWNHADFFAGCELGYLAGSAKGSSDMITGEQIARISSPVVGLHAGYRFISELSGAFGVQSWLSDGANFAPKDKAENNRIYTYAELGFSLPVLDPVTFALRFAKDLNVKDRDVQAVSLGMRYLLPI